MDLIDIGVNLTSSQFRQDREQVIERAIAAGVVHMVVTGTTLEHSINAQQLAQAHPQYLTSTAGIHPHHADQFNQHAETTLLDLAETPQVVAMGECGLDFNRNYSPQKDQLRCYEAQLELAIATELPVFLHQRDAHDAFIKILKKHRPNLSNAVVHCFTGNADELDECLDLDLHIGITGWICDERRGQTLQQIVNRIPLTRLMIETDAPYLLPRNLNPMPKSKRNEPYYLPQVCHTVARCYHLKSEDIAKATTLTAKAFFQLN